jgi:hypothetical protein
MLLGDGWFRRLVEELHSNQVPPPVAAWKALSKTATARRGTWDLDRSWGVREILPGILDDQRLGRM